MISMIVMMDLIDELFDSMRAFCMRRELVEVDEGTPRM